MRGANLPNQKRTPEQRESDREEIALSLAMGMSLRDIQETLNTTRPYRLSKVQIWKDAAHVRGDLQCLSEQNRAILRGRLLARLETALSEAYASWDASKKDRKRTILRPSGKASKVIEITESRCGDVRYMLLALAVLRLEAELLGLYAS